MFKKLSRAGNSHAIIIDKPILQLLGITPNTLLKITTDGNKIVIEPVSDHLAHNTGPQSSGSDNSGLL